MAASGWPHRAVLAGLAAALFRSAWPPHARGVAPPCGRGSWRSRRQREVGGATPPCGLEWRRSHQQRGVGSTAFPPMFIVALTLAIGPVAARAGATFNIDERPGGSLSLVASYTTRTRPRRQLGSRVPPRLALGRRCEAPPQGSRRSDKGSRAVSSGCLGMTQLRDG